jgi:hypothetical protein
MAAAANISQTPFNADLLFKALLPRCLFSMQFISYKDLSSQKY